MRSGFIASSVICISAGVFGWNTAAIAAEPAAAAQVQPQQNLDAAHELNDLVRFRMEEGYLLAGFSIPKEMLRARETPLRIKGSNAKWSVRIGHDMPSGHFGMATDPVIQLSYEDAGHAAQEGYTQATVHSSGGLLSITGKIRLDGELISFAYHGRRDHGSAQLEASVQRQDHWNEPLITVYGDSLRELYDEHGMEVDRYLGPVLKKISQQNLLGPGAADVYGAFTSIVPSPHAIADLRRTLAMMDSPDVQERQEASKALAKLGPAGVLAAMRFDAAWLSPEQRARMASFIHANRQRHLLRHDEARADLRFLTECLEHNDQAVRVEAKRALEQALHREITFDPDAGFDDRFMAVHTLRGELKI